MGKVKDLTLKEKYHALLADLIKESKVKRYPEWWKARLDGKIMDLKKAMKEGGYE